MRRVRRPACITAVQRCMDLTVHKAWSCVMGKGSKRTDAWGLRPRKEVSYV